MNPKDIAKLRTLTGFPALVAYLRDELDWPIEVEDADEVAFDYDAAELGINPKHAVKIETIKQVRPLVDNQPWGIFYVEFESKRLPVVVLRRILRSLVPESRRRDPDRPVWRMNDLLFISAQGETGYRSISFAHFRQPAVSNAERREGRVAELRREASARELLTILSTKKLVLDWRKRQQARAAVQVAIGGLVWQLPECYTDEMCCRRSDLVYQHVYDSYYSAGQNVYAVTGEGGLHCAFCAETRCM